MHSSELMEQFHVSKETIRRDLNLLEEQGLLRKVYGGAALDRIDPSFSTFQDRIVRNPLHKEEIALLAARYVVDEVSTKRALLQHAKRLILVCTSDRFDVTSLLNVCDLHLPDCIITDSQLSRHVRAAYESKHVRIVHS